MKKIKVKTLIDEITKRVIVELKERSNTNEGTGFDNIFNNLKNILPDISMLPDNIIDVSKYKESEVIDALKNMGYIYRKPTGGKLHFFNKKTSISVYLIQKDLKITLIP
jgi:hypothetical protein